MTCVRVQLTLKIIGQSFFSVPSQLTMGAMHGTHGAQISPLNELVILLMAKGETDPLPNFLTTASGPATILMADPRLTL
jgi:hypothetical protein